MSFFYHSNTKNVAVFCCTTEAAARDAAHVPAKTPHDDLPGQLRDDLQKSEFSL